MAVPVSRGDPTSASDVEDVEIELLLDALHRLFEADFRGYDRAHVRRKLFEFIQKNELDTISALQAFVIHDRAAADALLRLLTLRTTALFDDVAVYRSLREEMGALLRSYPSPKIWIAECTSAEDVFSIAIMLDEAGILDKTLIYTTCSNHALLEEVKTGRFDAGRLPEYERNYRQSGGAASFSDYWSRDGGRTVFLPKLARNITWSQYNLVTDTSFNEFQIIVCRNRLFDFGAMLRHRVLALFGDSLAQFGLLCTDRVNELHTVPFSLNYTPVFLEHGIYRRI